MHKKFGEDRTCSSEDMIAGRQTRAHTDRHAHHNTPLPYRNITSVGWQVTLCDPVWHVNYFSDVQVRLRTAISEYFTLILYFTLYFIIIISIISIIYSFI